MKLNFNLETIKKKVETLRKAIRYFEHNAKPMIYDKDLNQIREMTEEEKQEHLKSLNKGLDTLWFIDSQEGNAGVK